MTRRHAVVTGASSGIGRATALRLARDGYHVYATVRRESDGADLSGAAAGEITPLVMDVRSADQIARAARLVEAHVARTRTGCSGEQRRLRRRRAVPMDAFRDQLDVNVSGRGSRRFCPEDAPHRRP